MVYDELLNLLPPWFQNIKEYPEIMKAWGAVLDATEANSTHVRNNLFVQTCDVQTIEYWEKLLDIQTPPTATLDDRRNAVLNGLTVARGWTINDMRDYILAYLTSPYFIPLGDVWTQWQTNDAPYFDVWVSKPNRYAIRLFCELWYKVAPAHIALNIYDAIGEDINKHLYCGGACFATNIYNIG